MKGSMKQIKWAEDIKANAIGTCTANIERLGDEASATYEMDKVLVEVYRIFREALSAAFERIEDAAVIIDRRAKFDPSTINSKVQRTSELIKSGRLTLAQVAQANGVTR